MQGGTMIDETDNIDANRLFIPVLAPLYAALAPFSYAFIRILLGLVFLPSGIDKMFLGGNARIAEGNLKMLGLSYPYAWSWAVASVEFLGAILIILGLFTRGAAFAMVVMLTVITFGIQARAGYLFASRGFEVGLILELLFIAICFGGGGRFSLDRKIGREF